MKITLEELEKVMEETGLDYQAAKELLLKAEGDAEEAIRRVRSTGSEDVNRIVEELKARIREGNVDRVQLIRKGEVIFSVPLNVGIAGGLIGLMAAPFTMIATAVAAYGLECRIEIVRDDGTKEDFR